MLTNLSLSRLKRFRFELENDAKGKAHLVTYLEDAPTQVVERRLQVNAMLARVKRTNTEKA